MGAAGGPAALIGKSVEFRADTRRKKPLIRCLEIRIWEKDGKLYKARGKKEKIRTWNRGAICSKTGAMNITRRKISKGRFLLRKRGERGGRYIALT